MEFDILNTPQIVISYSIGLFFLYVFIKNSYKMMSSKWMESPRRRVEIFNVILAYGVSLFFWPMLLLPTTIYVIYYTSIL